MKTKLFFTLAFLCFFIGNAQWDLMRYNSQGTALATANKDTVIVVSYEGEQILHTDDGGQTWNSYQTDYEYSWFLDVCFPTDQIGYACGGTAFGMYRNIIIKTMDGGQTWNEITSNEFGGYSFTNIHFIDENIGFVTGDSGVGLLKTMDGGANFSSVSVSPSSVSFTDITFPTNDIGFVSVREYVDPDDIYKIYKTTDQGGNWTEIYTILNNSINEVQFLDENTGFGVGNDGLFIKTTDGGATWNTDYIPPYTNLTSVFFTSTSTGYINNAGGIYKTTDGGVTWTVQNISPLDIIQEIRFANDTIGYALGEDGVYKTINGGGLGTKTVENIQLKVFPNPTDEMLYLKTGQNFLIQKIRLLDMQGRAVKEYPEDTRQIDVSNFSAGNYFLQIFTDHGTTTKRVLIE